MKATYLKYILDFKRPSGTSRGVLTKKETWYLKLEEATQVGYGECGLLRGLSIDDRPDYEEKLKWVCQNITLKPSEILDELKEFPSIQFGYETALRSLQSKDPFELFPTDFTAGKKGITINGLVWMGEKAFMKKQIEEKLDQGFSCIKLKIGAIEFDKELDLLAFIRNEFSADKLELRVDANGAFSPDKVLEKLRKLSEFDLHSIEQPIKQGQPLNMGTLCKTTPLPIALDEELIGVFDKEEKKKLLKTIIPQYIILKPSLVGGFKGTQEWIDLAEENKIGWWITSALESNIGLNAIAQFTATKETTLPQGLGTGSLYTNNIPSPLSVKGEHLCYDSQNRWDLKPLKF